MKISVIGGGPGGLYFSILTKKRIPNCTIDVYEQNSFDDAFGFGVVFSDETLSEFLSYDMKSYELIRNSFAYWDDLDIVRNNEKVRIRGNGFCGCSRKTLLLLLQQRCQEEGITIHFNTKIDDLNQFKDSDLILASDGINSNIRSHREKEFGTSIEMKTNRFLWCGSAKPLDAFTYFFKDTPYGAFCAHTYQYEKGHSTWIFECSNQTFLDAGFEVEDEKGSVALLEQLFKTELEGYPLITNRSHWRQFPHVENKNWYHKNIVLLGDAKATAHYSIGSGTKLAMDCAIGLSDAVIKYPKDVQKAFEEYDRVRRTPVEMIQHAAVVSLNWFEAMDRHMKLDFDTFSFSVMSRSKKITIENQARRDADYAKRIVQSFLKKNHASESDCAPALTPYTLGSVELSNRVVMSSMGQYKSEDGIAGDWDFVHYTTRAVGGVGLLFTGMTAIAPEARITPKCYGIWNEAQVTAWKRITSFIHENTNSKIGIELGHAGRKGSCTAENLSVPLKKGGWDLISADALPYNTEFPAPKAIDEAAMEQVKNQFVAAAKRAVEANFDVVELQMHNGFLLYSFLSPLTNRRKDSYGGSISNRAKFPLAVVESIKNVIGNTPLIVKLGVEDWHPHGIRPEDALYVATQLKALGVAMIDVSTGNVVPDQQPMIGRMWQTPFSEWIRNTVNIPTLTTGRIETMDQVNTVLLNARADLVALGRTLLTSPYFVHQSKADLQYHADRLTATGIPTSYLKGAELAFIKAKKDKEEFEAMKKALKPKSHQQA